MHRTGALRKECIPAEVKLWACLRTLREEKIRFRRQHAIGPYITDFCAPRRELVIEVDGSQHLDQHEYDARRTAFLEEQGYRVLRFRNHDVMNDIRRHLMKNDAFRSRAVPLVAIPLAGLLVMALTLLLYGVLYNLLETLFFPGQPLRFPAGAFRTSFALALTLLYLLLLRTKLADLLKAILLTGPLSTVIITVGHALSDHPAISIPAMLVTIAVCGILLFRYKKPWTYFYAGAVAALVALAYAWPRPPL